MNHSVKIDMNQIQMTRKGKADGYLPEVRRGTGTHVPKTRKKKFKDSWKKEVRESY